MLINIMQQHNYFRQTWTIMRNACSSGRNPTGMTLRTFLNLGDNFVQELTLHHTIEEQRVFPVLARKMKPFGKELELLTQHRHIHEGLVTLEDYIRECREGQRDFVFAELGKIMDGFEEVLWQHLDEEVYELRAENMREYWSVDEMRRMPV
jgi:hemerythrin-like domain-containing protein